MKKIFGLLFCIIGEIESLEITEWNEQLYQQAVQYNPSIAHHFYCQTIGVDRFVEFAQIYTHRPIQQNVNGIRSQGNFFLWYLLKEIQPALVIESGIWRGQSTWMIEQAAPQAKVIAIDPDLSNRIYISSKVQYQVSDFSLLELRDEGPVVVFFDDHVNAYERVLQAAEKGVKHLIFDDNYAPGYDDTAAHLTLRQCFEMAEHQDKARVLTSLIKNYYIMPQIIGTIAGNFYGGMRPVTNLPAIWSSWQKTPPSASYWLKLFADDSIWYRWLTYVELN